MRRNKNLLKKIPLGISLIVSSCANDKRGSVIDIGNDDKKDLTMIEQTFIDAVEDSFYAAEGDEYDKQLEKFYFRFSSRIGDYAIQEAFSKALKNDNDGFIYFFYFHVFPKICADYKKDKSKTTLLDFLSSKFREIWILSDSTPLHWAVDIGSLEVVEYFVEEKGMNVDTLDSCSSTPLHCAASFGFVDIVDCLMRNGANFRASDCNGHIPFFLAFSHGKLNVVEYFIEKGYVNERIRNILTNSSGGALWDIVKRLERELSEKTKREAS